ncbi:hypothetical protein BJF79_32700 [Actinomadura sp. CNU-125]|uniref:DUF47 domain-containing protein n=1 Tax=Actinomadura sp. CNU-125 TaxID=1904961 RepID=UPI0009685513|nr:DUF47 family protein [Actinomadura sp. CNU-125]OLT34938.1 hypothetical protein BJF79_32700 [Actinomadura sp. CNU-125]
MSAAVRPVRRLRRVWDDLRGRSGDRVIGQVALQVRAARDGAELAREMAAGRTPSDAARARMTDIEHAGDAERASLAAMLDGVLAIPIDREDLYRLSRSVDDVLDNLRDFVREADLFGPPELGFAIPPLDAVLEGLTALDTAVRMVLAEPAAVTIASLAARKAGNRVRETRQAALTELFDGPLDVDMLRRRELLDRLDAVGRRLGEAADALSDAMLKRSH